MKRILSLWVLLGLMACGGEPVKYQLTTVLPATATPGTTVTLYGKLPDKGDLYLGDERVPVNVKPEGWQFTVPEGTSANTYVLSLKTSRQSLSGALQVIPRLDTVSLEDKTLQIRGAGWSTDARDVVVVEVAGMSLKPERTLGELRTELSKAISYGRFTVRIQVNGQTSQPLALSREAGGVSGKVAFPATPSTLRVQGSLKTKEPQSLTDLVVFHQTANRFDTLEGLREIQSLPQLQATHLSFHTSEQAQAAKQKLSTQQDLTVEWDQPVSADGFDSVALTGGVNMGEQWFLDLAGVKQAWTRTKGAGVVVAVLDTGVNLQHPDLQANLLPGYDFIDSDTEPMDRAGHGTHVAGLVAANGQVSGVAPEAKILPVRVLEGTSGGSAFTVAEGILWAANLLPALPNPNPAQVINLSLGSNNYSEIIADAIAQVQARGIIVVAASGNSSGPVAYPAALTGVIAVTSLAGPKFAYQPWYTNKGFGLWVTAYGGDTTQDQDGDKIPDGILSTDLTGYGLRMGTSMASPQVAGLVALALSSGTSKTIVKEAIAGTSTDLGIMGFDSDFGYGLATGRSITTSTPKSYVLAYDGVTLVHWSLVQDDSSFTLTNLPPNRSLTLYVASDEDGDRLLAEAGELLSTPLTIQPKAGQVTSVETLELNPSDGTHSLALEVR
jgi:serine protease